MPKHPRAFKIIQDFPKITVVYTLVRLYGILPLCEMLPTLDPRKSFCQASHVEMHRAWCESRKQRKHSWQNEMKEVRNKELLPFFSEASSTRSRSVAGSKANRPLWIFAVNPIWPFWKCLTSKRPGPRPLDMVWPVWPRKILEVSTFVKACSYSWPSRRLKGLFLFVSCSHRFRWVFSFSSSWAKTSDWGCERVESGPFTTCEVWTLRGVQEVPVTSVTESTQQRGAVSFLSVW